MKVLKDNYNNNISNVKHIKYEPYPRRLVCDCCGSELEYDESDLYMGAHGYVHLDCPCCGESNVLDLHEKNVTLTKDNIQFPLHFHHVCVENGAVDCCEECFPEYINKAINYLRQNKDEIFYGSHITGNFYIGIRRWDGDGVYDVTVSKDFYTMDIPFEKEDY